jgi:hypothetical protein
MPILPFEVIRYMVPDWFMRVSKGWALALLFMGARVARKDVSPGIALEKE